MAARERRLADQPAEPSRSVDGAADAAWTALYGALTAHAQLPEERFATARVAQELRAKIFPEDSLDFLRLRYVDQYGVMTTRVHRIQADGLVARIVELIGPTFWEEVLHTLERYTEMVRDGLEDPARDDDLNDALRQLRLRIADYDGLKVAAGARIDDPDSVQAARSRLSAMRVGKELARRTATRDRGNEPGGGEKPDDVDPKPSPPVHAIAKDAVDENEAEPRQDHEPLTTEDIT